MAHGAPGDGHQGLLDQLPSAGDGDAVAPVHDSKEAMRFRAICDERITIPLDALKQFPEVRSKLVGQLPQSAMVDVKVNWRCKHTWAAEGPQGDNPRERVANNMDVGIQQLDHGSETLPPPAPPANVTPRYPRLTASNVTSIVGKDWRKKHYPGASKDRHFFWGEAECGLTSISAWEVVTKEKGATKEGYMCRYCQGFWKASRGGSRFLQITGEHRGSLASLQLVLDEPPEANAWNSTRGWNPAPPHGTSAWNWWAR